MTAKEMSMLMEVLYNNISSNQAPGLSVYEKSLFLTKAQDEKLKNYLNPKGNKYGEGFDDNPKRQIDFSMLMSDFTEELIDHIADAIVDYRDKKHGVCSIPFILESTEHFTRAWAILNEFLVGESKDSKKRVLTVVPISFDEYARLMSKPYKRPLKGQAWRLQTNDASGRVRADIIASPDVDFDSEDYVWTYKARYIRKPKPIIVGDLGTGITIDGYTYGTGDNQTQGCELDPIIHEEIVQRAVELAKIAWQGDAQTVVQTGERSE